MAKITDRKHFRRNRRQRIGEGIHFYISKGVTLKMLTEQDATKSVSLVLVMHLFDQFTIQRKSRFPLEGRSHGVRCSQSKISASPPPPPILTELYF